jgi:hypothetical protein
MERIRTNARMAGWTKNAQRSGAVPLMSHQDEMLHFQRNNVWYRHCQGNNHQFFDDQDRYRIHFDVHWDQIDLYHIQRNHEHSTITSQQFVRV